MSVETADQILQKVHGLGAELGLERALGLSGSYAHGDTDALSDIDVCVFVSGRYPPAEIRRTAYAALSFTDAVYFDIDFDTSRGDGFLVSGMRCDFNWMVTEHVSAFLSRLNTDFDCPEWLPGGLETVKPLDDPQGTITGLQRSIPAYSGERARQRIHTALHDAHESIYKMGWLPKAVHRDDTFSYLKNQYQLLEKLFHVLFALNRVWFSDEKRLVQRLDAFEFAPAQAGPRIQHIIEHSGPARDLNSGLAEIKSLFRDTAVCVRRVYPDLDVPADW